MNERNVAIICSGAAERHGKNFSLDLEGKELIGENHDGTFTIYDLEKGSVIEQSDNPIDPRAIMRNRDIAQHTDPNINSPIVLD